MILFDCDHTMEALLAVVVGITRKTKKIFPCVTTVEITDLKTKDDTFEVHFLDETVVSIDKHGCTCSCTSNECLNHRKRRCRHISRVYKKLHLHKNNVSGKHLYSRLSCVLTEPDCTICLDKALYNEKKDLSGLDVIKMLWCDECGKVMHKVCCRRWQDSALGKKWERTCFICKSKLVDGV